MIHVPWFQKPENERTALQIVNLSPSESSIERLVDMHPMRQVFWASIIHASVFGFMLLAFYTIDKFVS